MKMQLIEESHQFIDEFSFGVIVSESLDATHLPFLLNQKEGNNGALYCHFARSNSHWKSLEGKKVLIIFNGPHAYISPSWYATVPAVPTWNYATVHVYGYVEVLDPEQTLDIVEQTVNKYEPSLLVKRNIVTEEVREKLKKGIVACKIVITNIEGKQKLGQGRSIDDQQGVVKGLLSSNDSNSINLLNYMTKGNIGLGKST